MLAASDALERDDIVSGGSISFSDPDALAKVERIPDAFRVDPTAFIVDLSTGVDVDAVAGTDIHDAGLDLAIFDDEQEAFNVHDFAIKQVPDDFVAGMIHGDSSG